MWQLRGPVAFAGGNGAWVTTGLGCKRFPHLHLPKLGTPQGLPRRFLRVDRRRLGSCPLLLSLDLGFNLDGVVAAFSIRLGFD